MEQVEGHLGGGRYRLVGKLGEGGMAMVYRATDERLGVDRAVKLLKSEVASRKSVLRRFEAEATTMAKLHHPNVVTVHDVVIDPERVFMVMELVDGGSLVDWLDANGPMPPRLAVLVATHMLAGLAAAHEEGVVHRDIKPHNVLISREGTPKITDFGIAHLEQQDHSYTRTGTVMGTWAYMPPEQRTSAKGVDARADLYSVGATIYALVRNTEPFDLYVSEGHEEMFEGVAPELVAVIKKACRYRPEDRYSDAAEMARALHAILPSLPVIPAETAPLATGVPAVDTTLALHTTASTDALGGVSLLESPHATSATTLNSRTVGAAALVAAGLGAALVGFAALGFLAWSLSQPTDGAIASTEPIAEPITEVSPEPEQPPAPEAEPEPEPEPMAVAPRAAPHPSSKPKDHPSSKPKPRPATKPKPKPKPAAVMGSVKVNSIPWSTVFIDGAEIKATPITDHALPVGTHTIKLVAGDGAETVRRVTVTEGEQVFFCWRFAEQSDC